MATNLSVVAVVVAAAVVVVAVVVVAVVVVAVVVVAVVGEKWGGGSGGGIGARRSDIAHKIFSVHLLSVSLLWQINK